jgi:HAD superfamily hydrolase (TIGR01509 family)
MVRTLTAALFDVDGTLVDSNYLHAVAWWEAFSQGGREIQVAQIHRTIGMGADQMLDALLPQDRDRANDNDIRAAHRVLYATYRCRIKPFAGAADLLRACQDAGLQVILASSADPPELAMLKAALDADEAISQTVSASDVNQTKPAPELVQVALDKAGVTASQAIFVGDAIWDVQACQRAGVPCIGLCSGGTSSADLLAAGAIAVFADPADLLSSTGGELSLALDRYREKT